MSQSASPDLILTNGRFTTLDRANPEPGGRRDHRRALLGRRGRARHHGRARGPATRTIDLRGRRAIPG
jgi:predicted amidohydrolase YtcJ